MIIVDSALRTRASEGRPIRVGVVGAGFMGSGIVRQVVGRVPGMVLAGVANRTPDRARQVIRDGGADPVRAETVDDVEAAVADGRCVWCEDPLLLTQAPSVDAIVEVTGSVGYAATVVLDAIETGTHVVLMNAELDGTVGPLLAAKAREAGVVLTGCDGDQPGVQLNLYRFVRGIGVQPLVCGNMKGLHDPSRNPTTQQGFAERWGQNVHMVTSFADGTKISFEQAIVANATGMGVARRGMGGRDFDGQVDAATSLYDIDELRSHGGVVDYIVGARPGPGVFVFGAHDDPRQRHYLELYKLGTGPLYSFYTPYHLCHFEVPTSVARAVDFGDAVIAPPGGPEVEVVTTAKIDLEAGLELDGFGGYHTYGLAENADAARDEDLLPMGLAQGCRLRHAVVQGEVLTWADVDRPGDRLVDRLWDEQRDRFGQPSAARGGTIRRRGASESSVSAVRAKGGARSTS